MNDLNDVAFFAAVVEHAGFSAAARYLKVPKSSVSRHVHRLEARLGVRVLERSTRHMRLTDVGNAFYSRCRVALADLREAEQDVVMKKTTPTGVVRVSCPLGLAQSALARLIPGFMSRYPLVRLNVVATNRAVDLIADRFDVALRARLRIPDESLTMRRLTSSHFIFVAKPGLVVEHERLDEPNDIQHLPFLSFHDEPGPRSWQLSGPHGAKKQVTLNPVLSTSEFSILIEAASAGLGVALLPIEIVSRSIAQGRLVRLLPSWHSTEVTLHIVFGSRRGLPAAVRAFIDYVVEHYEAAHRASMV